MNTKAERLKDAIKHEKPLPLYVMRSGRNPIGAYIRRHYGATYYLSMVIADWIIKDYYPALLKSALKPRATRSTISI